MIYSKEVEEMYCVKQGGNHGCAPIPEEGKWVYSKKSRIFLLTLMVSDGVLHSRVLVNFL